MKLGEDLIGRDSRPPFFRVAEPAALGIAVPAPRRPEGDAVRAVVRTLSGFQKEAFVASARTGRVWRLVSDEGAYLNGQDAAPCPLAFFTCGMIAGYLHEICALAAERGIDVSGLRLVQNNFYTMQGAMRDRSMIGGARPVELEVQIGAGAEDARLAQLCMDAVEAAPIRGLMRGVVPSLFALARNGAPLAPGGVGRLPGEVAPLPPRAALDAARPVSGGPDLIRRTGTTREKAQAGATSAGGSSLSDHQDRVLNPAATAWIEDGLVVIEQRLYSPRGSTFRFLSSEDGRAPDAATLLAAGIGFCFMTQFGRFAAMEKLDLPDYAIVQDLHLSAGGGSGGTGLPGAADPVETHVHLTTDMPDDAAREMLDVAERTCFLHAFCRTDLKTRLRLRQAA